MMILSSVKSISGHFPEWFVGDRSGSGGFEE